MAGCMSSKALDVLEEHCYATLSSSFHRRSDPPFEVLEVNKDKANSRTEPACETINPLLTPTLYSMNRSAPMESIRSGWKTCSNRTNPWLNRSTPLCHDKDNSRRFNHSGSIFATSCLSEGNSALQLNMGKSWLKRSTPLNQHERENSKTFKFASNLERSYNSEGKPTHLAETQKKALKLLSTAPPNFEGHAAASHSTPSMEFPGDKICGSRTNESNIETTMHPSFINIVTSTPLPCQKRNLRRLPAFSVETSAVEKEEMKQIQSNEAIDEEGLSYLSRKQNSTLELRSNHHGHASVSHSAMSLKYPGYAKIGSVQIHESFIDTTMQPSFHDIITSTPLPCHKIRSRQTQLPAFCVKNIATGKAVHNPMKLKEGIFDEKYVSEEELFSSDDEDPDWKFENDSDNLTDESEDEVTALNDLSIYEYFQKYRTVDEIDSDVPASDECLAKMSSIQTVNSACESEPGAISTRHDYAKKASPIVNISIQAVDDMAKECIDVKTSKWKQRLMNKKKKEKGLQYTRSDGVTMAARQIRPACDCRRKCKTKYSDAIRSKLLQNLLRLKLSGQNQFLSSHIIVTKTARQNVINSRRVHSRLYKLPGVNGPVTVCKVMFMGTFDVGDRKLRNLAAKKVLGAGVAADDGR